VHDPVASCLDSVAITVLVNPCQELVERIRMTRQAAHSRFRIRPIGRVNRPAASPAIETIDRGGHLRLKSRMAPIQGDLEA
jgi:hypothetical protein